MLKPHHCLLLVSLMVDGGTVAHQPAPQPPDADAGAIVAPRPTPRISSQDAGAATTPRATSPDAIRWPKDLRPLATLDGPAVLAAHAALQRVLSTFPKEHAGECEYSARSMDVVVGLEGGLYFVRVDRRPDRCGWAPGASLELDWFELYAVSPEGRVLERYPYMP